MKFLAIDYGQKRTGIAVSDEDGHLAFPRCTISMSTRDAFFAQLLKLVAEEQAGAIVVGMPFDLNGSETLTTRQVRNFLGRLSRRCPLPLYTMPEALSSIEAENELRAVGRHGVRMKAVLDQQAAVLILQSFLDQPEEKRQKFVDEKTSSQCIVQHQVFNSEFI